MRRIACAVVPSVALAAGAHAGFQTIVLTGDEAPGTGGAFGNSIGGFSVDSSGDVLLWSTLVGTSQSSNTGAFRSVDGALQKIAQEGDAAPGIPGETLRQVGVPFFSASGACVIDLRLNTSDNVTFDNDWGLWVDTGPGLELVAREGTEAPGLSGARFDRPGEGILSPGGNLAFLGRLQEGTGGVTPDDSSALWRRGVGGSLDLLAREGDATPGIEGGAFNFINTPDINDSGLVAFTGTARDASRIDRGAVINFDNDNGLWTANAEGDVEIVARESDPIPGFDGFTYGGFQSRPELNANGDIAITGSLNETGGDRGASLRGVFTTDGGALLPVAKTGDLAPGAGGGTYDSFLWTEINDNGDLVFGASTTSPDEAQARGEEPPGGLWLRGGGKEEIVPIALTGDTAPGTGGAAFDQLNSPVMNNRGDVVFSASLIIEGDVTFDTRSGVWAMIGASEGRGASALMKIARAGDEFEVAPGDVRTIGFVDVQGSGVEAFEPTPALNDSGQLAVRLGFEDGTGGLFLFEIPTPGSGAVLVLAGIIAVRRKR